MRSSTDGSQPAIKRKKPQNIYLKNMPKDFTHKSLEEENRYYREQAYHQSKLDYHKKMSKYFSSLAGTVHFLPGEMASNLNRGASRVKVAAQNLLKKIKKNKITK